MEKHVIRLSYMLCLLCAVLAILTRLLNAFGLPAALFIDRANPIGYHSFLDGVFLFFILTVASASFAWFKKHDS
jgi:hypothetical protein